MLAWSALLALTLIMASCAAPASPATQSLASEASTAASQSASPPLITTVEEADDAPPGAVEIVMTQTSEGPRFNPDEVTAREGTVVLFLRNDPAAGRPVPHNLFLGPTMDEAVAHTPQILPDKAVIFTIEGLPAGTYTFWCTVPASSGDYIHAAQGMVGTLTVTP